MIQLPKIIENFVKSYDAMVGIFAYTVGELSRSLPQSDHFCKAANHLLPAANHLLPAANQLLATTRKYDENDYFSSEKTSQLLDELLTSDTPTFEAVQRIGLMPLIRKILMYRHLIQAIKN